jgi:hypothetical protein
VDFVGTPPLLTRPNPRCRGAPGLRADHETLPTAPIIVAVFVEIS